MATPDRYREVAEAAWRWVLDQVRYDEGGPWIPPTPAATEPAWDRDGMHSGIGGLAHALAEVAATGPGRPRSPHWRPRSASGSGR